MNHTVIYLNSKQKITIIGEKSIVCGGTIIYLGISIGSNFKSGNNAIVIEDTIVDKNCFIGTLLEVQARLRIEAYVRIQF